MTPEANRAELAEFLLQAASALIEGDDPRLVAREVAAVLSPRTVCDLLEGELPQFEKLPYLDRWRRELASGVAGQDQRKPSTWRIDGLYRAACRQLAAEELEALLRDTARDPSVSIDVVRNLARQVEQERERAHRAFGGGREERHDKSKERKDPFAHAAPVRAPFAHAQLAGDAFKGER